MGRLTIAKMKEIEALLQSKELTQEEIASKYHVTKRWVTAINKKKGFTRQYVKHDRTYWKGNSENSAS